MSAKPLFFNFCALEFLQFALGRTFHSDQGHIAVAAGVLHRALVNLHVRGLLARLRLLAVLLVVGERRVLKVRQEVDLLLFVEGLKWTMSGNR